MIKVTDISTTDKENVYLISAFADTKSEVATGTFIGLPTGAEIAQSSDIMTAAGEMAFMKSDGTWNWV